MYGRSMSLVGRKLPQERYYFKEDALSSHLDIEQNPNVPAVLNVLILTLLFV